MSRREKKEKGLKEKEQYNGKEGMKQRKKEKTKT